MIEPVYLLPLKQAIKAEHYSPDERAELSVHSRDRALQSFFPSSYSSSFLQVLTSFYIYI